MWFASCFFFLLLHLAQRSCLSPSPCGISMSFSFFFIPGKDPPCNAHLSRCTLQPLCPLCLSIQTSASLSLSVYGAPFRFGLVSGCKGPQFRDGGREDCARHPFLRPFFSFSISLFFFFRVLVSYCSFSFWHHRRSEGAAVSERPLSFLLSAWGLCADIETSVWAERDKHRQTSSPTRFDRATGRLPVVCWSFLSLSLGLSVAFRL